MLIGIVLGESLDPAKVAFNRTLAESFELDKAGVFLIPLVGSDEVIFPNFFFS